MEPISVRKNDELKTGIILGMILTMIAIIGGIVFFVKLGAFSNSDSYFALVVSALAAITCFLYVIQLINMNKLQDELMVLYENEIHINNKKQDKILYQDIVKVSSKPARTKHRIYTFGTVKMKTKNKTFAIKYAENCKGVGSFILNKANNS